MVRSFKKVVTLVLVILLVTVGFSPVSFAGGTGGKLVAQYKFDGDFKDSSGNENHGTTVGDVTFADDAIVGKSAVFNGGFVKLAESPSLNLGGQFTISAWVKLNTDEAGQNNQNTIYAKVNNNDKEYYKDDYMYRAYLQGVHDARLGLSQLRHGYEPGVSSNGVGSLDFHEKWSLITFVNDGTRLHIYKDGELVASDKTGTGPDDPFNDTAAANIFIGGPTDLGLFKGKMDDLRIYNYPLNNDEVKALYNIGGYTNKIVLQIDNPVMMVDDKQQEIDPGKGTRPITVNDRTLVPIRAIIEAMGGTVNWTAEEERIDITLKSKQLQLWVGKTTANLNGNKLKLDVPPLVRNQRTLVPLRFVSENLGCKVEWDKTTQKITLLYSK